MTDYGQTRSVRPPSETVSCDRCRAVYVDDTEGRTAHRVVFGHQPHQGKGDR